MDLTAKKCVPCEGGMLPLLAAEVPALLQKVPGWEAAENTRIFREFTFKNFKDAMTFVDAVAALAEEEGHHPDILIHRWNKVRLELTTHAIKGLSENDFILAAKINVRVVDK